MIHMVTKRVMDVFEELSANPKAVPVGISARHLHLTKEHVEKLFGEGYRLTVLKNLSQLGQFAAVETVEIEGPKGKIQKVRVLGPEREASQVEIALSDARKLGIQPPVRSSGSISETPGITLKGPKGSVILDEGVMIPERHIHMQPEEAQWFGVEDGDVVKAEVGGIKGGIIDQITVRINESYRLELHLDTDDANAFLMIQNQKVTLLTQ